MSHFAKVSELSLFSKPVNLILKVVSREIVAVEKNQKFVMAEVVAGDDTGIVTLRMENEQIDVCHVGRTIVVRNAFPVAFDRQMRLEVGAFGKVTQSEDATFTPNQDVDASVSWQCY